MAARDRYDVDIECPKCKGKGVLHMSENDYPFMRSVDRRIDQVDGNFTARIVMKTRVEKIEINCGSCSETFEK